MGLPPLRTVKDSSAAPSSAGLATFSTSSTSTLTARPSPFAPAKAPSFQLDMPNWPKPAAQFVAELTRLQLLNLEQVNLLVGAVGKRANQLNTRELTADALVGLGFISSFVMTRVLSNQVHGLIMGPYRILDRLGSGSIGIVFLGEHMRLRRKVAIKTLPIDDTVPPQIVERFEREAQFLAGIDHPNIVRVYDIGTLEEAGAGLSEMRYQAQELVTGGDLENYIYDNGTQPISLVCEWGRQIASALKICHNAGLIHRDLKPSNLLLTESKRLKLVDFGLVRSYASVLTPSRVVLGSLEFLAPEQVAEPSTAGPAADVYSLGATLFWLFTGQLALPQAATQSEALDQIRNMLPRRAREIRPDFPRDLDQLLAKMLARNPAERPSISELQHAFQREASPSSLAGEVSPINQGQEAANEETIRQLEDVIVTLEKQSSQSRQAFLATIGALTATCPGETHEHQKRLSRAVRLIAPYLATKPNWPMMADPRQVDDYARAIAVHDLGLVIIGAEARHMEIHTTIADEILGITAQEGGHTLPFLRLVRNVIRHHHEAWNGTGYPEHLKEQHIPAIARLAAVLITYDDLRRGALGEPPMNHASASRYIQSHSGVNFDPQVVEAFLACEGEMDRHFWEVLEPGMTAPPVELVAKPVAAPAPKLATAVNHPTPPAKAGLPVRRWGNADPKK
jgi:serine/threonine protein kinase